MLKWPPGHRWSWPQGFGTGFNHRGSAMVWLHLPLPTGQKTRTRLSPLGSWGLGCRDPARQGWGHPARQDLGQTPVRQTGTRSHPKGARVGLWEQLQWSSPRELRWAGLRGHILIKKLKPQNNKKHPKMNSLQYLERCRLSSAGTMLASRFSGIWDREGMLLPETRAMRRCRERAQGVKLQKSYVRGELGLESLVAGFSPSHEVIRVTKGSSPRRAVSIATPACSCEPSDSSNTATPRAGARIVTLAPRRELTFVGREKNKK